MQTLRDLAKYQIGDLVYRVRLVQKPIPDITAEDAWKAECHPKINYGPENRPWDCSQGVPRVGDFDFALLMGVLTSKIKISRFTIDDLHRSPHTGEIVYRHGTQWLPEAFVFGSVKAARAERERIKKLVAMWARGDL